MKKHNIFKVVLITLLVMVFLSWIFPAASFSNGYVEQERMQVGLFDIFNYSISSFSYFFHMFVYVLVIGGFYGVLNHISAYRKMLDKMAKTFKKAPKITISVMVALLAILTSVGGFQLGLLIFVPMIISLILLMGYDKVTAAIVIVGSLMVGIAGTTLGYNNTGVMSSILQGLEFKSSMLFKIIVLVVGMALVIMNALLYTRKSSTKKTNKKAAKTKKEVVSEETFVPAKVSARTKTSIVPLVVMISILFVILLLSFMPWAGALKVKVFDNITKSVASFKLFKFTIFDALLGEVVAFGQWTVIELSIVTLLVVLLTSFIYKMKFDDMIDNFVAGAKKALPTAVLVVLVYVCLVIATYHPFQLYIYKVILDITNGFNLVTGSIVAFLASIINIEPLYTFQSALPYIASITKPSDYNLVALVFQTIYGVTMLIAPTSVILVAVLSYLGISYGKWLKTIWKLFLEMLLVALFVLIAMTNAVAALILLVCVVVIVVIATLVYKKVAKA